MIRGRGHDAKHIPGFTLGNGFIASALKGTGIPQRHVARFPATLSGRVRIGAPHTCTNHTVPYGTSLWGGVAPGTSCQATIRLSLRDKSHPPIEDSHEVSVYASSPRGLAASRWAPRTEEQHTGETPTTIASAPCLPKVVGHRGVLPSRSVQAPGPEGPRKFPERVGPKMDAKHIPRVSLKALSELPKIGNKLLKLLSP
jgi:hypothetical protein